MSDKPVRVLRLMEYIYPDAESAMRDMAMWQVQGTYHPNRVTTIRSTVLPMEVWEPEADEPDDEGQVILKTPEMWAVEHRVYIMDADGWRESSELGAKDFDTPITETEFIIRLSSCTQKKRDPEIDIEAAIRQGEDEGT